MDSEIFAALETAKVQVLELIKKTLKPEFYNRIDEVITFQPLKENEIEQIVKLQLKKLQEQLIEKDVQLFFTDEVIKLIAHQGYDPQFGARPLKRLITKEVINQLSKMLLSDTLERNKPIVADNIEGEIVFRNKIETDMDLF